jgi:hypothetical protein
MREEVRMGDCLVFITEFNGSLGNGSPNSISEINSRRTASVK